MSENETLSLFCDGEHLSLFHLKVATQLRDGEANSLTQVRNHNEKFIMLYYVSAMKDFKSLGVDTPPWL